jgi:hypothetical protein
MVDGDHTLSAGTVADTQHIDELTLPGASEKGAQLCGEGS